MGGELVLGYDGSDGARVALERALDLAPRLGVGVVAVFGYKPGLPGEERSVHAEALRELGEQAGADALEEAGRRGISLEVDLRPERPVDALLSAARELEATMIVVGSYGESPIRGAILGATPHKLLHLSEWPVLVVPT